MGPIMQELRTIGEMKKLWCHKSFSTEYRKRCSALGCTAWQTLHTVQYCTNPNAEEDIFDINNKIEWVKTDQTDDDGKDIWMRELPDELHRGICMDLER